ncbi:tachykinin-like peptides receptor 99D [Ochlerotatus camptorhynchus]|uniref:tachykinin-like peptides receptor 99D n=1 Tax=Ochlerotatus camptorhynchus TaxID=644619 RepID=UPI0031E2E8A2
MTRNTRFPREQCSKVRLDYSIAVCKTRQSDWTSSNWRSPILVIAKYEFVDYVNNKKMPMCLTSVEGFWNASFFVASIVVFFIVPLLILVMLYSVIAKNLMDNPGIIMSNASGNRNNVLKYRKQAIFMLGAVVVSFFFCLLPFRALTLWIIIVPSESIVSIGMERFYILVYFCRIMLYMNSAINPILYNLMSSKFRNGFLQLLGCGKIIRSDSMSSGARKGTFHTASTNLSSSHNSSCQRRLTREGSSVSGSIRAVTEYNSSRKRLLYQRHNSTISIKSSHDDQSGSGGGSVPGVSCTLETTPLKTDKIDELEETTNSLPNGYGFHRFKHATTGGDSSNVSSRTNSCNGKTSHRVNGSVSVEPKVVPHTDNKYVIVRAAVVVMREVQEQPGEGEESGMPKSSSSVEPDSTEEKVTLIQNTRGSEQIVSIITAKERTNGNYVNQGQRVDGNGGDERDKSDLNDEVAFDDEITKIRQFYGSMECDI